VEEPRDENRSSRKPIGRRTFFGLLLASATAIAGIISIDSLLPRTAKPEPSTSIAAPTIQTTATKILTTQSAQSTTVTSEPKAVRVVIVSGTASTEPQLLVDTALEALGGVERLVPSGANILVKPNVGFYDKDATTDPRITAAVVNALKRARPNRIIVGESALRGIDVAHALDVTGTRSLAEAAGAEVRDLRNDEIVSIATPNGLAVKSLNVFRTARDSFIVSVPRLKRHSGAIVTISMKNMIGAVPDSEKGRFHQVNLEECIADLNVAIPPRLVIVDATRAMTKTGPSGGVMVDLNLVFASTDPVAVDLVAAQELFKAEGNSDPRAAAAEVSYIQSAARAGVGVADLSKIQVLNVSVA
jgi:uncharacterized protein (DUF362 family)